MRGRGRPPKSLNPAAYRRKSSSIDADSPPPRMTVRQKKMRKISTEDADSSEDEYNEEPSQYGAAGVLTRKSRLSQELLFNE